MPKRKPSIELARAYGLSKQARGCRVLVDRVWPRGVSKDELDLAYWFKDVAPSTALRRWFGHRPERWQEFRRRYFEELEANSSALKPLLEIANEKPLLLIFGARDVEHNQAVALRDFLRTKLG